MALSNQYRAFDRQNSTQAFTAACFERIDTFPWKCWKNYLDHIPMGPGAEHFRGKKMDPTVFEKLSAEQLGQMYELMHATRDVWKSADQLAESSVESGEGKSQ
ncbi:hypothetical protein EW146_g6388 [Bondarzewia mesenterica]|uniref:Succinate dehydrogenase assembly factor 3, mitochondrial n=1 Tax=Bondarzewia mesenterica TaxID=1095465 RepID=A0A4S4LPM6_9AGAM|nr:hypothetical protein EW146_g6388 [Bondarzewia mesenterica]